MIRRSEREHGGTLDLQAAWFGLGGPLQIVIFAICSYQAYWALANMVTLAEGSTANVVVTGAISVAVILGRNVIAVRLPTMSAVQWFSGFVCLIMCMAFSVVTSEIHLAQQVQGGHVASIKNSDEYQRADAAYRSAIASSKKAEANMAEAEREIKIATDKGDIASSGHLRRGLDSAENRIDRANQRVERARAEMAGLSRSGQSGVAATILTETAQKFEMTPEEFSVAIATLAALLLEMLGVILAWYDGNNMRKNELATAEKLRAAPATA